MTDTIQVDKGFLDYRGLQTYNALVTAKNAVTLAESNSDNYAKVYTLAQGEKSIGSINIPKDMVVSSGSVETKTVAGAWGQPGTYIILKLANSNNDTLYINASELIDDVNADWNATTGMAKILNKPTALPASDVKTWAKADVKPTYTAEEVGADPSGTASNMISTHNTSTSAHQDIRSAIPTKVSQLDNDSNFLVAQDISGKADKTEIPKKISDLLNDKNYLTSQDIVDKANKSEIPTAATIADWGFSKSEGTYSKPSSGIPKTDLSSSVQASLDKADTALQTHQDISGKLDKTGGVVSGSLILSKTNDLSGKSDNSPALIVGGTTTQPHLEIDNNEIQAKSNATSTAPLYLNNDGGDVYTGGNIVLANQISMSFDSVNKCLNFNFL